MSAELLLAHLRQQLDGDIRTVCLNSRFSPRFWLLTEYRHTEVRLLWCHSKLWETIIEGIHLPSSVLTLQYHLVRLAKCEDQVYPQVRCTASL